MSEVSARYTVIADAFTRCLSGVDAGTRSNPSPCTEWTAEDVADHVIKVHRQVLSALTGEEAAELVPSDDREKVWSETSGRVHEVLADPKQATKTISGGPFGEQPFESLVGRLLCADTLIHTWDLARATGQDDRLDAGAVDAAMAFLRPIDEAIRRPGGFAAKIEPPPGADAQTRLLNFAGRAT